MASNNRLVDSTLSPTAALSTVKLWKLCDWQATITIWSAANFEASQKCLPFSSEQFPERKKKKNCVECRRLSLSAIETYKKTYWEASNKTARWRVVLPLVTAPAAPWEAVNHTPPPIGPIRGHVTKIKHDFFFSCGSLPPAGAALSRDTLAGFVRPQSVPLSDRQSLQRVSRWFFQFIWPAHRPIWPARGFRGSFLHGYSFDR